MRLMSSCPRPGHRLVEQHHLGIERERGGDLERALAAVGQLDRRQLGEGRQADRLDQLERAPVQRIEDLLGAPEEEELRSLRCSATRTFSRTER